MIDYIPEIAKVSKSERFDAIVNAIGAMGLAHRIEPVPGGSGNIIVDIKPESTDDKIVISAHYDNFAGTPGANDNAAACSILLNLIGEAVRTGIDKHIEFVFFDLEESGLRGSNEYVRNNKNISAAYNLDMCGMGSNIIIALYNDFENAVHRVPAGHDVIELSNLPGGDAYTFRDNGIPTMYVVNSTDNDVEWFKNFANGFWRSNRTPDFARTMHRSNDTPGTCNIEQVEKIYKFMVSNIA